MEEMDANGNRKCCQKCCLDTFPQELIRKTHDQMARLGLQDKNMFLLGKISSAVDLLNPSTELVGAASKGTPSYYDFDRHHNLCRVAFETVFGITAGHMRVLKRHLLKNGVDADIPNSRGQKKREKRRHPEPIPMPVNIDPHKELEVVRAAMKQRCCEVGCLANFPENMMVKTRIEMANLTERERELFLFGKISSSVSLLPGTSEFSGGVRTVYLVDKEYSSCANAFQFIYDISDDFLKRLRFSLFENGMDLSSNQSDEAHWKKKNIPTEEEEKTLVENALIKGCCRRECCRKIGIPLLLQSRATMRRLTADERHMFILGKISSSVASVRPAIVASERRTQASYHFDKDHVICKETFHLAYTVSSNQVSTLRGHLVTSGATRLIHKLKGRPSNAKGHKRKPKGSAAVEESSDVQNVSQNDEESTEEEAEE
ncbi:hypothetical protein BV898_00911 [Hypsibius exemplaris]|uniref:Uncharacterized protein n=1 Tax=Hypsibius exemplaris TaxID=2072580 RepID=A0A1W0XCL8_HYPEX|nr:hypothetical protein BV898_00911 [Hypsibius exemplaris]